MRALPIMAALLLSAAVSLAAERIDDATLTAKVKAALAADDEVKARQVEIETRDGVVQLSGFVESQDMIDAALKAASSVQGVKEVRNDLAIRGQAPARPEGNDAVIAARVKSRLGDAGLVDASGVNVEVREGVVQLSGFVTNVDEKNRAGEIASRIEGVRDVRNNIALLK